MLNAIFLYRLERQLYLLHVPLIPKLIKLIIFLLYNSSIPYEASIGRNSKFGYGAIGVVIHKDVIIGENCVIAQNVTIGGKKGCTKLPIVGDDVYIGAGAVLLGGISIGDSAVVGANAVVTKDVPSKSIVAGIPAKILRYIN